MSRRARLVAVALLLTAAPARAGAWSQPEGALYLRLASKLYLASSRFDADGRRQQGDWWDPDAKLDAWSWNLIAEYGLFGPLTFTFDTTVKRLHSSYQLNYGRDTVVAGLADTALGLRWGFWQRALVAAVDARVELPGGYRRYADQVSLGAGFSAISARALLGGPLGLPIGGYFDFNAGYRYRFGPFAGDLMAAGAVGVEPVKQLWVRVGASGLYNLRPSDSYIGTADSSYLALSGAITWLFASGIGVELGASVDLWGRNSFAGAGVEVVVDFRRRLFGQ